VSEAPQMIGRWKTIPVTMCVNHPDRRARARALCPSCYVSIHYAKSPAYRASSKMRAKEWVRDNPERAKAIQQRKRENACPVKEKGRVLKRKYGITIEQFDQMLTAQSGACAICRSLPAQGKSLHVDHCHSTGRVRGLLCHQCNWYLGKVDSDAALIGRLLRYLEAPNGQH
jgi:hypothetical protein